MPKASPNASQFEYSLRWVREGWVCVGHVYFMLFVSCFLALGTKREHIFWWNMGFQGDIIGRPPVQKVPQWSSRMEDKYCKDDLGMKNK